MTRNLLIGALCLALVAPSLLVGAGAEAGQSAKQPYSSLPPKSSSAAPQGQQPSDVRPNSTAPQRGYTHTSSKRHRRHISRGEVIFMAGIAGTSMGIGALAGGGTGLAIGAIVGGWGAYAGHRVWHWVK
jgi:hypothetical protein